MDPQRVCPTARFCASVITVDSYLWDQEKAVGDPGDR